MNRIRGSSGRELQQRVLQVRRRMIPHGTFPPFEEVLRGAGEAEDPQHSVSSVDHGSGRADGAVEHLTPNRLR